MSELIPLGIIAFIIVVTGLTLLDIRAEKKERKGIKKDVYK